MLVKKFIATITHLLLPYLCLFCASKTTHYICHDCQQNLPILPNPCQKCAQPLFSSQQQICGKCLKTPPAYDHLHALFAYQPPIPQMIIRLKFAHQLTYAYAFSELLLAQIQHNWYAQQSLPDIIIPIPLHRQRLRQRGFNQAIEIAKPLAKKLAIPIDYTNVQRCKFTQAQSGLSAQERKANVAQAFVAKGNYFGLHLAVLDDVVTTGHTINEFCQLLRSKGANKIDVWSCARRI